MTGYGRDERTSGDFLIKTEIKTLNSKFFDLLTKYGKELFAKEMNIRNMILDKLKRGKIMLTIDFLPKISDAKVDDDLFYVYYEKFHALFKTIKNADYEIFKLALQTPKVIIQQESDANDVQWEDVFQSVEAAIHQCIQFRRKEGKVLVTKLKEHLRQIEKNLKKIEQAEVNRLANVKARLQKNMDELPEKTRIDETRLEQEVLYYLERMDITEEKVRLKHHLKYFQETLMKEAQAGKKLGFLVQEMGREINTIGSKANDINIQHAVVVMKDELEKIKEQTLNIL